MLSTLHNSNTTRGRSKRRSKASPPHGARTQLAHDVASVGALLNMNVYQKVLTVCIDSNSSVCVLVHEPLPQRHGEDLQVQRERPVLDVEQVDRKSVV